MCKEDIEEATDIILNSIIKSELSIYTKVELMINLRKFLENYNENIILLKINEDKEKCK